MFDGATLPQPASQPAPYRPAGCREDGAAWLCVFTGPRQELLANGCLRALGLVTWMPEYAAKERLRLLFPRYLLVQADLAADPWRLIYRQRGVATILGTNYERPATVPAAALAVLWRDCAPNGVIYPRAADIAAPLPTIAPGAAVTVRAGAFADLHGICQRSDKDRVTILLSVLGRTVPVTMARAAVA